MPTEVRFYECTSCYEQYESWSQAEACEWEHQEQEERA